ncbi:MAG: Spy/CpxP family protein refolding chaperone [Candidatus Saganbacteria bacterium]|nr:Spy/CpxP family protein refolding chaperone [Candidatus Saganbacteria bacterium]
MKRNYFLVLFLIGVFMVSCSSGVFAMGKRPAPEDKGKFTEGLTGKLAEKMTKDLALTEKQKNAFLTGIKATEEEAKEIRKKNKVLFEKIDIEIQKDTPDISAVNKYLKEIGQNKTQVQIKRMDNILQFTQTLTPEQRAKFKELQKQRKERPLKKSENTDRRPRSFGR